MLTKIKELRSNEFMRHNAVFWVASLLVSFLNYLYYPVLGRLMHPADFGETQTVISIITQTGIFLQVLGLVNVSIITKYQDKQQREALSGELSRMTLLLSVVAFVAIIAFSPLLQGFFHFYTTAPFFILGLSILVSVPGSFANAYLQGNKKFGSLAISNIAGASAKLLLAIGFVLLGFKTIGAVGGLVVSQVLTLIYALNKGSGIRTFVSANLHLRRPQLALIRPELPFTVMVFATSLTTNLLLSFDILVVKHFFPPAQAGLYTGISITSNIIYYLCAPFISVMVPSLSPGASEADNLKLLRRSLQLTVSFGGAVLLAFLIAPHLVVGLLLGHTYSPYADYLRGLGVSIFALSLANVMIMYHIGLRHFWVAPTVLLGLVSTLLLLSRFHATIGAVVGDLITGALILLAALIGLTLTYYRRRHTV